MFFNFSHRNFHENTALNLYTCGIQNCQSGHSYGPVIRSGYLIHLVLEGSGSYTVQGKTYNIGKNQGFLIEPNELIYYEADKNEPWKYIWIGFTGTKAKEYLNKTTLSNSNPVFDYENKDNILNSIKTIISASKLTSNNNLMILSKLYEFFYFLCEYFPSEKSDKQNNISNYLEDALLFIQLHYSENISIQDIANQIRIDRSYLHRIFKKNINKSPQEYLIELRVEKSCDLLKSSPYKISDIARSVGYTDSLLFSKIFKKHTGFTPSKYRELNK